MPYEYNAKLVRVIDGDSIVVSIDLGFGVWFNNQSIRMYGVDAPESRTRDEVEKVYGLLAKQYLIDRCPESFVIRTHADGKGKYGRILGEVICYVPEFDREMSINDAMIKQHLVAPYYGQSKEDIKEIHLANRKILMEAGKVGVSPDYR